MTTVKLCPIQIRIRMGSPAIPIRIWTKSELGRNIYTDSMKSPSLLWPLLNTVMPIDNDECSVVFADAVSCYKILNSMVKSTAGHTMLEVNQFFVEFWDSQITTSLGAVLSLTLYAPLHWGAKKFLYVLEENAYKHGTISILKTFSINGKFFLFQVINTMHHRYIS